MGVGTDAMAYVWTSEDNLGESVLSVDCAVSETELRVSGLAANVFTH